MLGRIYASDLIADGRADAVVLELPPACSAATTGELLGALLTAGAFAAFLSTSSGLTMSIAGVVGQALSHRGGMSNITAIRWRRSVESWCRWCSRSRPIASRWRAR